MLYMKDTNNILMRSNYDKHAMWYVKNLIILDFSNRYTFLQQKRLEKCNIFNF